MSVRLLLVTALLSPLLAVCVFAQEHIIKFASIAPDGSTWANVMREYDAAADRFPGAERRESAIKDDNPMYVRDYSKCLLCWRCVQVCDEDAQYTYAINFSGRGYETQIATFFDRPIPETTCVLCGQCVGVCPTGALKAKREYLLENGMSPAEISVLSTGRRRRRERPA